MWTLVFAVLGALSPVLTAAAFALQEPTSE